MNTQANDKPAAIQVRARITPEQYRRLRILAIEAGRETSELVADALIDTYNLNGDTQ